jgi:polyphosphate glucokinase
MNVLVIDIGGTGVKLLVTGHDAPRKFPSGPDLTPEQMVGAVVQAAAGWDYEAVSVGYPGPVLHGRPLIDPVNLGPGWVGFDFAAAFGRPVKVVNDAAMQALGSYEGGKMLFLGLGTGLGSAMIADGVSEPMELAHLPYRKATFEDYVGIRGLKRLGKKKWRRAVFDVVARLTAALEPDYVVLGGGNVKRLKELPPKCRAGDNANAFLGGFRLWESADQPPLAPRKSTNEERTNSCRKEHANGDSRPPDRIGRWFAELLRGRGTARGSHPRPPAGVLAPHEPAPGPPPGRLCRGTTHAPAADPRGRRRPPAGGRDQ